MEFEKKLDFILSILDKDDFLPAEEYYKETQRIGISMAEVHELELILRRKEFIMHTPYTFGGKHYNDAFILRPEGKAFLKKGGFVGQLKRSQKEHETIIETYKWTRRNTWAVIATAAITLVTLLYMICCH